MLHQAAKSFVVLAVAMSLAVVPINDAQARRGRGIAVGIAVGIIALAIIGAEASAIGTSAGIVKFSDKRKCQSDTHKNQSDARKSQSANGVAGPVTRTATAAMSVKVANTYAARNDGVAVQVPLPINSKRSLLASRHAGLRSSLR